MRLLPIAATALAALAGCVLVADGACATSPSPSHTLDVEVEDACAFYGEGSPVTVRLGAFSGLASATFGVVVPPGVAVVEGATERESAVPARGHAELALVLRATEPGAHRLHAWARLRDASPGLGTPLGIARDVVIAGNSSAAETHAMPAAVPFRVRIDAEPDNATRLVATFESPVEVRAHAQLYFSWLPLGRDPPGYDPQANPPQRYPIEGHPEWTGEPRYGGDVVRSAFLPWNGTLRPGEPLVLRFHAPPPAPADAPHLPSEWTVAAYLLPDPRVAAGPYVDEAGFAWDGHAGRLLRNRVVPQGGAGGGVWYGG